MKRKMDKYLNLLDQYNTLDEEQEALYEGEIFLPKDKEKDYRELQIKKIAILEEMEKCL